MPYAGRIVRIGISYVSTAHRGRLGLLSPTARRNIAKLTVGGVGIFDIFLTREHLDSNRRNIFNIDARLYPPPSLTIAEGDIINLVTDYSDSEATCTTLTIFIELDA